MKSKSKKLVSAVVADVAAVVSVWTVVVSIGMGMIVVSSAEDLSVSLCTVVVSVVIISVVVSAVVMVGKLMVVVAVVSGGNQSTSVFEFSVSAA